jgi:hypothetical protein
MAASKWTNLICDVEGPGCFNDPYLAYTDKITEARELAARDRGWARVGGKDVCPGCKSEATK